MLLVVVVRKCVVTGLPVISVSLPVFPLPLPLSLLSLGRLGLVRQRRSQVGLVVVGLQLAAVSWPWECLTGVGQWSALLYLVVGGVVVTLAAVLRLNVTIAGPGSGHHDIIVSTGHQHWAASADSSASSLQSALPPHPGLASSLTTTSTPPPASLRPHLTPPLLSVVVMTGSSLLPPPSHSPAQSSHRPDHCCEGLRESSPPSDVMNTA